MSTSSNGPPLWRLWALIVFFAMCAAGLSGRLAYLQVLQHPEYRAEAQGEHIGEKVVPAHRGAILDRNGFPFATSTDTWDVAVDLKIWSDQAVATRGAEKLAPLLGRSAGEVLAAAGSGQQGSATIARLVEYETGRKIAALGLEGVLLDQTSRRVYPEGDAAAALVGFTGRDGNGLTGLEMDLDAVLTGTPGRLWFERDVLGNPIAFGYRREEPAVAGRDVVLTIDRTIQRMAERELDDALKKTKATGGTIIVQDVHTGAILAMVSRPSFSRERLDLSDPKQMELVRNRAVTDQYEPGSVFKLVTMAAAIDSGKVTPGTTYMDTGQALVGERVFKNWDLSANGPTSMTTVLVRSLNTGTVWLADRVLGAETFYRYVKAFGFGRETGAGITGEAPGMYRLPTDDAWYRADLASNSFGQGITATPLQMVNMVSALANGGKLMRPYVVQETRGAGGVRRTDPEVMGQPISAASARTMQQMMREVLEANTFAKVPGYTAAGKSGTAYVPTVVTNSKGDAYVQEVTIPSYAGYAPATNPRIAVLVKLDNLGTSDFGGTLTAPIFSRLTQGILTYLRVPPDRPESLVHERRAGQ